MPRRRGREYLRPPGCDFASTAMNRSVCVILPPTQISTRHESIDISAQRKIYLLKYQKEFLTRNNLSKLLRPNLESTLPAASCVGLRKKKKESIPSNYFYARQPAQRLRRSSQIGCIRISYCDLPL